MNLAHARSATLAAMVAVLMTTSPAAAQTTQALPTQPRLEGQGIAHGLAAIAALGLLLDHDDDEEEGDQGTSGPALPARCLATWRTTDGAVTLYDSDCLDRAVPAAGRLPLACAVTVRSGGRFISGFSPACLRNRGWRTPH